MTQRGGVLVTGANSGIGAATAAALAAAGFRVWAGHRAPGDADALAALGPQVTPVEIDVTKREQIAAAIARIEADGGLYGVVNNAGIVVAGPLEALPLDDLRMQFEVNVIGAVAVTQAALPLLRRSVGRVVNVGSISARSSFPFTAAYAASKAALRQINDALRLELAPWDIRVTLLEPGAIRTPIWERSARASSERFAGIDPTMRARYEERLQGMRKVAQLAGTNGAGPELVANVIRDALLSPRPPKVVVVGRDAKIQATIAAVVPIGMRDRLVTGLLGRAARS